MKYDHIIWDFNGTILDDVETGIISVNKLLSERNLKTLKNKDEYRRVFRFPIIGYYEALGFDFSKEPYEKIAPLWVDEYLKNVKNASVYPDVLEALGFFKNRGIAQTVLSATEINMLTEQISSLALGRYFEELLGLDNIHAASKAVLAERWREKHPESSVLLIGDTDHDLQVAKCIGADCALVCRGHQSREYLLSLDTKVFDNLLQICIDIDR